MLVEQLNTASATDGLLVLHGLKQTPARAETLRPDPACCPSGPVRLL